MVFLLGLLVMLLAGCIGVRPPHYYEQRSLTACVRHTFVSPGGTVDDQAIVATGSATMPECLKSLAH